MQDASFITNFRKRKAVKVICLLTAVVFLFNTVAQDVVWAAKTPSGLTSVGSGDAGSQLTRSGGEVKELKIASFVLPPELGTVRDAWAPERSTIHNPRSTVIHIQDAHCNYAAQRKIADIISYLYTNYGVNLINLEGGAEGYDLTPFTNIADMPIRERATDYFVKAGLVNGAEYFAINNPDKISLWGVEDVDLYIDNLKVYRNSLAYKNEVEEGLKSISLVLSSLKPRIYSKELLDFDMNYTAYKAGNLEFKEYLKYLLSQTTKTTYEVSKVNAQGKPRRLYSNLELLGRTLEAESAIDFRRANNERDFLIDRLQKGLPRIALEELVKKTVEFKAESIPANDYYAYIKAKADTLSINLDEYPDLSKYIAYVSIYDKVDKSRTMDEMASLEDTLLRSLCRNDTERELSVLSKNLALLKNIFNISLTRDDYAYYLKNENAFDMRNFTKFINREAPAYKISARPNGDVERVDEHRREISRFYEYSFSRDEAFVRNIKSGVLRGQKSEVRSQKSEVREQNRGAIIVTGGFHTENLCELFKKNGIAYVSIMPNFRNAEGYECPYFNLLSGEDQLRIKTALPAVLKSMMAVGAQLNTEIDVAVRKLDKELQVMPSEAMSTPVTPTAPALVTPDPTAGFTALELSVSVALSLVVGAFLVLAAGPLAALPFAAILGVVASSEAFNRIPFLRTVSIPAAIPKFLAVGPMAMVQAAPKRPRRPKVDKVIVDDIPLPAMTGDFCREMNEDERKNIIGEMEKKFAIHGSGFDNRVLTFRVLAKHAPPVFEMTAELGRKIYFSRPYKKEERNAIVAYVQDDDGTYVARTYYQSESQGLWRYLPGYTMLKTEDGSEKPDWYDKFIAEGTITLPFVLQAAIASIVDLQPPVKYDDSDYPHLTDLMFFGTAKRLEHIARVGLISPTDDRSIIGDLGLEPYRLNGGLFGDPREPIEPDEMSFDSKYARVDAADFNQEPVLTYSMPCPGNLYKSITVEVYLSGDGTRAYSVCVDSKDTKHERPWIGVVEMAKSGLTPQGLHSVGIDAGNLTTPLFEYSRVAGEYGDWTDARKGYVSMWLNYLSKFPILIEYAAARERRLARLSPAALAKKLFRGEEGVGKVSSSFIGDKIEGIKNPDYARMFNFKIEQFIDARTEGLSPKDKIAFLEQLKSALAALEKPAPATTVDEFKKELPHIWAMLSVGGYLEATGIDKSLLNTPAARDEALARVLAGTDIDELKKVNDNLEPSRLREIREKIAERLKNNFDIPANIYYAAKKVVVEEEHLKQPPYVDISIFYPDDVPVWRGLSDSDTKKASEFAGLPGKYEPVSHWGLGSHEIALNYIPLFGLLMGNAILVKMTLGKLRENGVLMPDGSNEVGKVKLAHYYPTTPIPIEDLEIIRNEEELRAVVVTTRDVEPAPALAAGTPLHFEAFRLTDADARNEVNVEAEKNARASAKKSVPDVTDAAGNATDAFEMIQDDLDKVRVALKLESDGDLGALLAKALAQLAEWGLDPSKITSKKVLIALLGKNNSKHMFENCKDDGFAGVNEDFLNLARELAEINPELARIIFIVGIAHELRHEAGVVAENDKLDAIFMAGLMTDRGVTAAQFVSSIGVVKEHLGDTGFMMAVAMVMFDIGLSKKYDFLKYEFPKTSIKSAIDGMMIKPLMSTVSDIVSNKLFISKEIIQPVSTFISKSKLKGPESTNPPSEDGKSMDVTEDYALGTEVPSDVMSEEEILERVQEEAQRLSTEEPGAASALKKIMKDIRRTMASGEYSKIAMVARIMAGFMDSIHKADPERYILHFARDMGLTHIIQETLKTLNGETGTQSGVFYLNTPMMGTVYGELNMKLRQWSAAGEDLDEKSAEWFEERMRGADGEKTPFVELAERARQCLEGMDSGVFTQDKVLLFDTGFVGTMPWYVSALIRYYDKAAERPARDVKVLLVHSTASTREVGESDLMAKVLSIFRKAKSLWNMLKSNSTMLGVLEGIGNSRFHPVRFDRRGGRNGAIVAEDAQNRLYFHLMGLTFMNMAVAQKLDALVHDEVEVKDVKIDLPGFDGIIEKYMTSGKPVIVTADDFKSTMADILSANKKASDLGVGPKALLSTGSVYEKFKPFGSEFFKGPFYVDPYRSGTSKESYYINPYQAGQPKSYDIKMIEPVKFDIELKDFIWGFKPVMPKINPYGFTGALTTTLVGTAIGVAVFTGLIGVEQAVSLVEHAILLGLSLSFVAMRYRAFLDSIRNGLIQDAEFGAASDAVLGARATEIFVNGTNRKAPMTSIVDEIVEMDIDRFESTIGDAAAISVFNSRGYWYNLTPDAEGKVKVYVKVSTKPQMDTPLLTARSGTRYANNSLYDGVFNRLFVVRNAARVTGFGLGLILAHERGKRFFARNRILRRFFGWRMAEFCGNVSELAFLLSMAITPGSRIRGITEVAISVITLNPFNLFGPVFARLFIGPVVRAYNGVTTRSRKSSILAAMDNAQPGWDSKFFKRPGIGKSVAENIWNRAVEKGKALADERVNVFRDWFKVSFGQEMPVVMLLSQREMNRLGANGQPVIRFGNNVVIARDYYKKNLSTPRGTQEYQLIMAAHRGETVMDPLLNVLAHEALANWLENASGDPANPLAAEDMPMMIEGLLKDMTGFVDQADRIRQAAHKGVAVDRALEGAAPAPIGGARKKIVDTDGVLRPEVRRALVDLADRSPSRHDESLAVDLGIGGDPVVINFTQVEYSANDPIDRLLSSNGIVDAYNLSDPAYIFVRTGQPDADIAFEHETLEIAWREWIQGYLKTAPPEKAAKLRAILDALKQKDQDPIDRASHILAWASQILRHADWQQNIRKCTFIMDQLKSMSLDSLKLIAEDAKTGRELHYELIGFFLEIDDLEEVKSFDEGVAAIAEAMMPYEHTPDEEEETPRTLDPEEEALIQPYAYLTELYGDEPWIDLFENAAEHTDALFEVTLPMIEHSLSQEMLEEFWPAIVELLKDPGAYDRVIWESAVPALDFGSGEDLERTVNVLIELQAAAGRSLKGPLLERAVPAIAFMIRSGDDLKRAGMDLISLCRLSDDPINLLEERLPALAIALASERGYKFEMAWPHIVAGLSISRGFESLIAEFKEAVGEDFAEYLPDLLKIAVSVNESDYGEIASGIIIDLIRSFGKDLKTFLPEIVALSDKAGSDVIYVYMAIPKLRRLIRAPNDLQLIGNDLIAIVTPFQDYNIGSLFMDAIDECAPFISDRDSLNRVCEEIVPFIDIIMAQETIDDAEYLFHETIPNFKYLAKSAADLALLIKDLGALVKRVGADAPLLFEFGLPAIKDLITDMDSFKGVVTDLLVLMDACAADEDFLSKTLPALGKLIGSRKDLDYLAAWAKADEALETGILKEFLSMTILERDAYLVDRDRNLEFIKSGGFNPKDPTHAMLGYGILMRDLKKTPQFQKDISYKQYKNLLKGKDIKGKKWIGSAKERAEITYLCYEALQLANFLSELRKKTDRPIVVVENLTYGWLAVSPIEEDLRAMGIRIIRTKAGSTYAHDHPFTMHGPSSNKDDADLFERSDLEYIVNNEPIVVAVDGTYSLDPQVMQNRTRKNARLPDAHQAYRNYFHAISGDPNDAYFGIDGLELKDGGMLGKELRDSRLYKKVRSRAEKIKTADKRGNYSMLFWYPGKRDRFMCSSERVEREFPKEMTLSNPTDPADLHFNRMKGPTLIMVIANMEDETIDKKVRVKGVRHNSAFFDDREVVSQAFIKITDRGPVVNFKAFGDLTREEYKRIKKLYGVTIAPEESAAPALVEHAGFGLAMTGDAWCSETVVKADREKLETEISAKRVPLGFSVHKVRIDKKEVPVYVRDGFAYKGGMQKYIDDCIKIRDPDGKLDLAKKLSLKHHLILDYREKSPNLFGDCQDNGYIYVNRLAPPELYVIGGSHELMHEAGIFTDSPEDEAELAKKDIDLISERGLTAALEQALAEGAVMTPEFTIAIISEECLFENEIDQGKRVRDTNEEIADRSRLGESDESAFTELYRGMRLSPADLANVMRNGLDKEMTSPPGIINFARTPGSATVSYAFHPIAGSNYPKDNFMAVIVEVDKKEAEKQGPHMSDSHAVKIYASIPLECIKRIWVFNKEAENGQGKFVEVRFEKPPAPAVVPEGRMQIIVNNLRLVLGIDEGAQQRQLETLAGIVHSVRMRKEFADDWGTGRHERIAAALGKEIEKPGYDLGGLDLAKVRERISAVATADMGGKPFRMPGSPLEWNVTIPDITLSSTDAADNYLATTQIVASLSRYLVSSSTEDVADVMTRCTGSQFIDAAHLTGEVRVSFYNSGQNKNVFRVEFGVEGGRDLEVIVAVKAPRAGSKVDMGDEISVLRELKGKVKVPRVGGSFTTMDGQEAFIVQFIPGKTIGEIEETDSRASTRLDHANLIAWSLLDVYIALNGRAPTDIHRYNFIQEDETGDVVPIDFDYTVLQTSAQLFLRIYEYYYRVGLPIEDLASVVLERLGREEGGRFLAGVIEEIEGYEGSFSVPRETEVQTRWIEGDFYEPYTDPEMILPIIGHEDLDSVKKALEEVIGRDTGLSPPAAPADAMEEVALRVSGLLDGTAADIDNAYMCLEDGRMADAVQYIGRVRVNVNQISTEDLRSVGEELRKRYREVRLELFEMARDVSRYQSMNLIRRVEAETAFREEALEIIRKYAGDKGLGWSEESMAEAARIIARTIILGDKQGTAKADVFSALSRMEGFEGRVNDIYNRVLPEFERFKETVPAEVPAPVPAEMLVEEEFEALLADHPDFKDNSDIGKLFEAAKTPEEQERALKAIEYFVRTTSAESDILKTVRPPVTERVIFAPITGKISGVEGSILQRGMQRIWKIERNRLATEYQFKVGNVILVFYDGTLDDLERKEAGIRDQGIELTEINSVAFMDGETNSEAEISKFFTDKKMNRITDRLQVPGKPAYFSIGAHVAIGLGVLDVMADGESHPKLINALKMLLSRISEDGTSYEDIKDAEDLKNILRSGKLVILLPPAEEIDIDEKMSTLILTEEAAMKSL